MKNVAISVAAIALSFSAIYGVYWVAKTVSYKVFYEDMVLESIKQTVTKSCIKEQK